MSHNMQGGYKTTSIRSSMLEWVCEQKPLAVLLQETWLSGDDKFLRSTMAAEAPEYTLVTASSCNHTGRGGTAVIIHKSVGLAVVQNKVYAASEGNILAVPVRTLVSGQLMWLVSIYVPCDAKDRDSFFKKDMYKLLEHMAIEGKAADIIIVGTDANAVMDPSQDIQWERYNPATRDSNLNLYSESSKMFNAWLDTADLLDTWKRHHQGVREYTRLAQVHSQVDKRLDFISSSTEGLEIVV